MAYEPPIKIIMEDLAANIVEQREDAIVTKVKETFGIHVDKEELLRALEYDRQQYNNGFMDGYKQGIQEGRKIMVETLCQALKERFGEGEHNETVEM